MDLSLSANPKVSWLEVRQTGVPYDTPSLVLAPGRRSGCFPALPYPPPGRFHLRPDSSDELKTACFIRRLRSRKPCPDRRYPLAGFEVITIGRFWGDNRGVSGVMLIVPPGPSWILPVRR